jgi:hypothetical protein
LGIPDRDRNAADAGMAGIHGAAVQNRRIRRLCRQTEQKQPGEKRPSQCTYTEHADRDPERMFLDEIVKESRLARPQCYYH